MNNTIYRENALAEYIKSHEYGTIIRYQEIEQITGTKYKSQEYYNVIQKAKKQLEPAGKAVVAIGHGDYQIIHPGDYAGAYAREIKRAKKRIKHGAQLLQGAPVKDMTADELTVYHRVNDFSTRLMASFSGSVVEIKKLTTPKHPLEKALESATRGQR